MVPFWGRKYREYFVDRYLPSLLAPNNLPLLNQARGRCRLRVRAQRRRQPVHAVRAARRLAPHQGDGPPYRHRYAHVLKNLADIHFPLVKTILLVQDNLNIHRASLYEAFPPAEARRFDVEISFNSP
jgi:hypothetical protein